MDTILSMFDDFEYPEKVSDILKPPFAFPGGKQRSVIHLLPHLPVERAWVDVCGGSGVVTLNRPKSKLEVYNDRWSALTDFYMVIQDDEMCEQFTGLLDTAIHSREVWEWAHIAQEDSKDRVKRAFAWYYNIIFSFSSLGRNFGRTTRGSSTLAKTLVKKIKRFREIHERFQDIQVENMSLFRCLQEYDDYDVVFYIDPPYYPESPGIYKHTMKKQDHIQMLNLIFELKGFVALSGYENDLYDEYPWDNIESWDSLVSINSAGYEGNNKQHVIDHKRQKAKEHLWIKESYA